MSEDIPDCDGDMRGVAISLLRNDLCDLSNSLTVLFDGTSRIDLDRDHVSSRPRLARWRWWKHWRRHSR